MWELEGSRHLFLAPKNQQEDIENEEENDGDLQSHHPPV
jgi:hypothetical protein